MISNGKWTEWSTSQSSRENPWIVRYVVRLLKVEVRKTERTLFSENVSNLFKQFYKPVRRQQQRTIKCKLLTREWLYYRYPISSNWITMMAFHLRNKQARGEPVQLLLVRLRTVIGSNGKSLKRITNSTNYSWCIHGLCIGRTGRNSSQVHLYLAVNGVSTSWTRVLLNLFTAVPNNKAVYTGIYHAIIEVTFLPPVYTPNDLRCNFQGI